MSIGGVLRGRPPICHKGNMEGREGAPDEKAKAVVVCQPPPEVSRAGATTPCPAFPRQPPPLSISALATVAFNAAVTLPSACAKYKHTYLGQVIE